MVAVQFVELSPLIHAEDGRGGCCASVSVGFAAAAVGRPRSLENRPVTQPLAEVALEVTRVLFLADPDPGGLQLRRIRQAQRLPVMKAARADKAAVASKIIDLL